MLGQPSACHQTVTNLYFAEQASVNVCYWLNDSCLYLFIPIERLAEFLFAPRETGSVTYPRLRVASEGDPVNDSLLFGRAIPSSTAQTRALSTQHISSST